jgi:hypothetical protein
MTDEDIVKLAKQAGYDFYPLHRNEMISFARLIVKNQQAIDAQICQYLNKNIGDSLLYEAADAIRNGGKS